MTWDKLPWMPTLLIDPTRDIRIRKASQMGVSTYCILWAMWLAKTDQASRGIAYWLPTDGDVTDFVHTKVNPMVAQNPEMFQDARVAEARFDSRKVDNIRLKFMWNTPTYWRGIKSKSAVKSISADATIFDEFDECEPEQVTQARERMAASEAKLVRELSTPTIPDFGIDKRFNDSDQRYVHFKCAACGHWECLEQSFPNCIMQGKDGHYYRGCTKCFVPLDLTRFQWVIKHPGNNIHGYQISQLYSPWVNLDELMKEFYETEYPGHFHNHKLGMPYISAADRVTKEQVMALCDPLSPMRHQSQSQCVAGIDVGKVLHTTVLLPGSPDRVLWAGELLHFEDIDSLISRFGIKTLVIDALPETHKVRELIGKFKSKVFACWYLEGHKNEPAWDQENNTVKVNRTESLDASTMAIHNEAIRFPQASPVMEEYAQQCANIVKTVETDEETGDKKYVYRRIGPDHYRHSLNYAKIAASLHRSKGTLAVWR